MECFALLCLKEPIPNSPIPHSQFPILKMTASSLSRADSLIQALQEPGRERLLDLVRNPLRLTLLCHTWQYGSSLPDTQAQLYEKYFDANLGINYWNKNLEQLEAHADRCQTDIIDLQDRLARKLGELAKAALDMPKEGFRLSRTLVEKHLGKEIDKKSLCHLALGLGWLNRLGKDSRGKDIFTFYHATFQEYFAALAVDDWDYFLPKQHRNFPVPGKEYRILLPQWRQVILLWLGRDSGVAEEEKERFIEALLNFDEGCGDWHYEKADRGFYEYRAYFLAAAGISEFKNCSLADGIVEQIVKWRFGYFNEEKQEWVKYPDRIGNAARDIMTQTDRDRAIRELSQILKSPHSSGYTRMQAAYILDEIDPDKKEAIAALLELIKTTDNKYIRSDAVETLGETGQGNKEAIAALLELIKTTEKEGVRRQSASILGQIDPGNKEAIAALLELIKTAEDEDIFLEAAQVLGEIGQGNKEAIDTLVELIKTTKNEMERSLAAYSLGQIEQGNKEAIAALLEIVKTTEDENIRWLGALILGEIEPDNKEAIAASFQVIKTTENENIRSFSIVSLGQIGQGNKEAIAILVELVKTAENQNIRRLAAETLAEIGQGNKEAIAALVQLIEATENEETRWRAAESLGEINPGNKKDITALVQLIEDVKNEETRWLAAESLGKIDPGNKKAIAALVKLIETTEDENIRRQAAESLGQIDPGNEEAIAALVQLIKTTEHKHVLFVANRSLEKIIATPEQQRDVVSALRPYLSPETYENNFDLFENCYGILWKIAQDLPYPEFYSAWHG
ncbi:MAG: hypothetical protein F6J93_23595 [Oscillatoria sp. SIO1A7]|nr:hypothetical protein [Oscillatoria sp. SIO1A7]